MKYMQGNDEFVEPDRVILVNANNEGAISMAPTIMQRRKML